MFATLRKFVPSLVLFLFASPIIGQVTTGIHPYGTYDKPGIDTINVGNLNVHIGFPVLNKAGRGQPLSFNLSYDSSIWATTSVSGVKSWVPASNFGWSGDTQILAGYMTYSSTMTTSGSCTTTVYSSFFYNDSVGVAHPFSGTTTAVIGNGCTGSVSTLNAVATDGSGYTLSVNFFTTSTVTTRLGTSMVVPNIGNGTATIADSNGNQITANGSGQIIDTTGNVALTIAGTAPNPHTFTYTDTTGTAQEVSMSYQNYTVQTAFGCPNTYQSNIREYGPKTISLVNTITYPDGSTYTFSYEPTPGKTGAVTGRIASIELPQGGTIDYTYTGNNNGILCADGSTIGLTRTTSSTAVAPATTITYTRNTNGNQTTVVDGLGNTKKYVFVGPLNTVGGNYYESSRRIVQNGITTPILTRTTCYNLTTQSSSPCSTQATITLPISQIDTYQTLNGIEMNGTTSKFDLYGDLLESDVYDFGGASSRGSLLRKEVWTYGYYFAGLPTQDEVFDGSGYEAGNTVFAYDQTTTTASSGVPQHTLPAYPPGNLTTLKQFASSGIFYATTFTYEDTGSRLTSTGPSGTTTYSYDPTFVYLTGVSAPTPSSGVALASSTAYDTVYTGLPLSSKDPNLQQTGIPSYDSNLRPTEVQYPDGGQTKFTYSPTTLSSSTLQSSGVSIASEVGYDNYGRPGRVQVANGQSGNDYYQQDTCYDANGNANFSSYPYAGTGFSTNSPICSGSGGDLYTYDVLGRVLTVQRGNGETITYTYNGRATESVDPNSVTKISQIDGLGRPTIVCEVSSSTQLGGGTPASCGTDITTGSPSGYITYYTYALATATTTVTQGVQSRAFQTDWLGRTIWVSEPESGNTTYSYSYNSTGLVVTRIRPKANQPSTTVQTTTTTQYDTLGRVISISYTDGTPTKNFAYDKSAGTGFSDLAQAYLKGRLSLASIAGTNQPATAFSYDPVGRVSVLDECLPSGCGTVTYNRQLHYIYDLAGDVTSSTDGSTGPSTTSTYTYSPASELLSLTSSLNNTTNPPNILSSAANGPNGPINLTLGNGLASVFGYDALGRLNAGYLCSGSTSPSCTGGIQKYEFTAAWKGQQLTNSTDSVLNQTSAYGYDNFNRLTSLNVQSGSGLSYGYAYDRYGNRWQQNITGQTNCPSCTGPAPQYSFTAVNNHLVGFTYDAAGNVWSDGSLNYTHDAEGNLTGVTGGTSTGSYIYDALNHRVKSTIGSTTTEFVFNANGQRASEWNGTPHQQLKGHYYAGGQPVAYYTTAASSSGAALHFEHQDWLGTERLRTSYTGAVEDSFTNLPFGDNYSVSGGTSTDPYGFAMLDYDSEDNTDHAQFRQYSSAQGRWLSPDPYYGSYDLSNPQSMNRYAYALNNPLSLIDPTGLDCIYANNEDGSPNIVYGDCLSEDDDGVYVNCDGCLTDPNQTLSVTVWYTTMGPLPLFYPSIFSYTNLGPAVGGGGGGGGSAPNNGNNKSDQWPVNGNLIPGTYPQDGVCTTGPLSGPMNSDPLILSCCQAHDNCYAAHGCNATSWIPNPLPWGACNTCNLKAAICIKNALPPIFIP